MYKKEVMEQHEKGFHKAVRQTRFFAQDLDLGLFDPFKDMKDGVLLDEEDIATEEEASEEQDAEDQGDDVNVQATFCLFSTLLGLWPHWLCNYDNSSFDNEFAFLHRQILLYLYVLYVAFCLCKALLLVVV